MATDCRRGCALRGHLDSICACTPWLSERCDVPTTLESCGCRIPHQEDEWRMSVCYVSGDIADTIYPSGYLEFAWPAAAAERHPNTQCHPSRDAAAFHQ